jgi:hypothetical protein
MGRSPAILINQNPAKYLFSQSKIRYGVALPGPRATRFRENDRFNFTAWKHDSSWIRGVAVRELLLLWPVLGGVTGITRRRLGPGRASHWWAVASRSAPR